MWTEESESSQAQSSIAIWVAAVLLCCAIGWAVFDWNTGGNRRFLAIGLPQPDEAYWDVPGYQVFVWRCVNEKRIVLYREFNALAMGGAFKRQESGCGELTPAEQDLADEGYPGGRVDPEVYW